MIKDCKSGNEHKTSPVQNSGPANKLDAMLVIGTTIYINILILCSNVASATLVLSSLVMWYHEFIINSSVSMNIMN
jgi:hypothetical protein